MSRINEIALPQDAVPAVAGVEPTPDPVLLVVANSDARAATIHEVCAFLGIRAEPVEDTAGIAHTLAALRPIAVLAIAAEIDCAAYDLLMAVAGFDADLPVLMVTDDRAPICRAVDATRRLWQLTDLTHLTRAIDTRDLVDFLFHAGRKSDTGRMMPV